jgi:hypothetical protein
MKIANCCHKEADGTDVGVGFEVGAGTGGGTGTGGGGTTTTGVGGGAGTTTGIHRLRSLTKSVSTGAPLGSFCVPH